MWLFGEKDRVVMPTLNCSNWERFLLWVDGVGGYLVCLKSSVTLGRAEPKGGADVPLIADLSVKHARIIREDEGYFIEAFRPTWLDGRLVERTTLVPDSCEIRLGTAARLRFRRSHALSASARLEYLSGHRTLPTTDGTLLMADHLLLGAKSRCHVFCRDWTQEVVLFRDGGRLYCKSRRRFAVDGKPVDDRAPLGITSHVQGEDWSFTLEPLPG
ncbi:FHA domain-containing protein [Thermopirellula anaerolimosa]